MQQKYTGRQRVGVERGSLGSTVTDRVLMRRAAGVAKVGGVLMIGRCVYCSQCTQDFVFLYRKPTNMAAELSERIGELVIPASVQCTTPQTSDNDLRTLRGTGRACVSLPPPKVS